ncbi:uncharacterized protein K452DRAFT_88591 [Aplosporella prunicola CBS 121167]|uniref:Uncharacterized protein n=1 Tax=Aplosporella prunicola CBS 121167 TaxID=1176127 RepID=A0A6A6B2Y0_9PEZI|nr:uncharacterized protein K452DRAFT_88591 [Aplosporella prunicola CBS 121167]KAF2138572.1 hypothetical protein K452DRAFT_88591 [Aplosporella prunicola CBS 121167]
MLYEESFSRPHINADLKHTITNSSATSQPRNQSSTQPITTPLKPTTTTTMPQSQQAQPQIPTDPYLLAALAFMGLASFLDHVQTAHQTAHDEQARQITTLEARLEAAAADRECARRELGDVRAELRAWAAENRGRDQSVDSEEVDEGKDGVQQTSGQGGKPRCWAKRCRDVLGCWKGEKARS